MSNKKIVSLITIFVLAGALVVFLKIPELQNGKKNRKGNSEDNYVKVESIEKQSQLNEKYDNLDVSDTKINIPKNIIYGELEIPELFSKKDKTCKDFFDLTENTFKIDKDLYKNSEFSYKTYPIGPEISDDGVYAAIGCTGFATVDFVDDSYDNDGIIETINLNDYDDKEYTIANGKGKISEFVSYADKFFKKYTELFNVSAVPETVSICENKKLGKYMKIRYQQSIDGVHLANIISSYGNDTNKKVSTCDYGEIWISGMKEKDIIKIIIQEKLKLNSHSKIKKAVSLNQAADLLNKKLAKDRKYKIKDIGIEYLLQYKGNKQKEGIEQSEYNHYEKASEELVCSFDYYSFEPYWTFYIDKTYQKEITGYVNCRSGDVIFVNNQ